MNLHNQTKKEGVVTIEDVAKLAGVSRATAGRVIGNYGSVSESSKKKVKKAADELNYFPNAIAQSLKAKKTNIIAVMVNSIANNFFSKVIEAIENEAYTIGYQVIISSIHENIHNEINHLRNLQSRKVDAIILSSMQSKVAKEYRHFYDSEIPMVYIDHPIVGLPRDLIVSDNYGGTYEATKHLLQLGHRRIGVLSTSNFPVVRDRVKGYRKALERYGVPFDKKLIVDVPYHRADAGVHMVQELLDRCQDVTAVIILNNVLCDGVLLALRERGLKVPDDISLITWDDSSLNDLLGITAVAQFPQLIGKEAIAQAVRRIEWIKNNGDSEPSYIQKVMKTELRLRSSVLNIR